MLLRWEYKSTTPRSQYRDNFNTALMQHHGKHRPACRLPTNKYKDSASTNSVGTLALEQPSEFNKAAGCSSTLHLHCMLALSSKHYMAPHPPEPIGTQLKPAPQHKAWVAAQVYTTSLMYMKWFPPVYIHSCSFHTQEEA